MRPRKTKIIATLGPASESRETLAAMAAAGMDVARLNFSHGDAATHRRMAGMVREIAAESGRPMALLQDIQGPKIRLGTFPGGGLDLAEGATVEMRSGRAQGGGDVLYVDYPSLDDLEPGQQILLVDGLVRLEVVEAHADKLSAVVRTGGRIGDHQGAAFPRARLKVPILDDKDRRDLELGRELAVDYVAVSFARSAADLEEVAAVVGPEVPLIAKIELAVAWEHLEGILEVAHGAMVARGDLGVEIPLQRLPRAQAEILTASNHAGRISITATEMLESMRQSSRPTRAEVADVASAVQGGTDAVMLSGETAVGRHPTKVIAAMDTICREVESGLDSEPRQTLVALASEHPVATATTRAAVEAATALELDTIVAFTESGNTARLLSKHRPSSRIVAFTPERRTLQRMALYWGVEPRLFERFSSTDEMLLHADRALVAAEVCRAGETVLMVAGIPPNERNSTNFMKLHTIGAGSGVR